MCAILGYVFFNVHIYVNQSFLGSQITFVASSKLICILFSLHFIQSYQVFVSQITRQQSRIYSKLQKFLKFLGYKYVVIQFSYYFHQIFLQSSQIHSDTVFNLYQPGLPKFPWFPSNDTVYLAIIFSAF